MPDYDTQRLRARISVRLVLSYVFDWIALVAVVVCAALVGRLEPMKRPFPLDDPGISFPFTENETVPLYLLLILCVAVPAVFIAVVTLLFVPGPISTWRRKLWELHISILGLALALVAAWFFTECMKNMYGKPRPDMLSRCEPDWENAADYAVGALADFRNASRRLYSADICQQTDSAKLDDGFRSYPSGHSSASAAGLLYLSLFLASKFRLATPFYPRYGLGSQPRTNTRPLPANTQYTGIAGDSIGSAQAAAAPIYLLVLSLAPFCLTVFIASSRWFDYRHHGFDILFGFIIGCITAAGSFSYYHVPIARGGGWAWGPRSSDSAFWSGIGTAGYIDESRRPEKRDGNDVELGQFVDDRGHGRIHSMDSDRGGRTV